jgi:hypothetical protein
LIFRPVYALINLQWVLFLKLTKQFPFKFQNLLFCNRKTRNGWGELHVVDIGLSKKYLREIEVAHFLTTLKSVRKIIKPRSRFDHKGKFGHALLIAGSTGKMGACILSTKAALRSGVGLLTVHVPGKGYSIIQTAVPKHGNN